MIEIGLIYGLIAIMLVLVLSIIIMGRISEVVTPVSNPLFSNNTLVVELTFELRKLKQIIDSPAYNMDK